MSDPGNVRPEDFVEYRLVRLADQLERRFTAALAPTELSPRQFSVLAVLASTPDVTSAGLARAVLTTPQSMHTLLDQLQSRGLIDRGQVRGRGRPAPVRLTPDGLALLSAASARVTELEDETRARLGEARYHQLVRLLGRVEDVVGVDRSGEK